MKMEITFDEVLQEMQRLTARDPEGFTVAEMAASTGHGHQWCRMSVKSLIACGKVVYAGRARRQTMDGRTCLVPVYRVAKDG
jgi:hypothetical protein